MHTTTQSFQNALAYFTTAVSYTRQMFIKLKPDDQMKKGEKPSKVLTKFLIERGGLLCLAVENDR